MSLTNSSYFAVLTDERYPSIESSRAFNPWCFT